MIDFEALRRRMVERDLAGRGITDEHVLRAMAEVPREAFVPTELRSHYFQASLPRQFDEYIWFDRTRAVHPLSGPELEGMPDTYPFGL